MMGNHVLITHKHALFISNLIVFMREIYKFHP